MLNIGDKMPEFAVVDETGKQVTDKDLRGKKTVIYFYPKDSTPGCTAEACNLRDNYHAFLARLPSLRCEQGFGCLARQVQSQIRLALPAPE